jgi:hypothetical protein
MIDKRQVQLPKRLRAGEGQTFPLRNIPPTPASYSSGAVEQDSKVPKAICGTSMKVPASGGVQAQRADAETAASFVSLPLSFSVRAND